MKVKLGDLKQGTMFRYKGQLYEMGAKHGAPTVWCSPSLGGVVQESANLVQEIPVTAEVIVTPD